MRSTAKSPSGLILGVVLLTIPVSLTSSLGIETRKWYRLPNTTVALSNAASASASASECAAVCLQRNGCVEFCYDRTTKACHVTASTPVGVPVQKDRLKCYKSTKQADGCPANKSYSLFDGRCMKLVQTNVVGETAQSQCHQDGGHLYYFKDDNDDKKAVEKLLNNRSFSFSDDVRLWVGARRTPGSSVYEWDDGAPVDCHLWNSNEPTDNSDCCVVLRSDYTLANNACTFTRSFICQFDV